MTDKYVNDHVINDLETNSKHSDDHEEPIISKALPSEVSTKKQKTRGVLKIEAYSKYYQHPFYKLLLFFSVFLIAYTYGLDSSVRSVNLAYAQSSYSTHSLLSTVNCIQAVIAAAGQLAFARISDVFGRLTLIFIVVIFYVMGTIIESQATNVQKFAAGAVFYSLGLTSLSLMLEVITSDFSNLNWRVVASFVVASPFIINTWVSGNVQTAVGGMNWKFGIGMWAFILPLACIPLVLCMLHMQYLARKNGDLAKIKQETKAQWEDAGWKKFLIETFFWDLDLVGLILTILTFGLILVPFTLGGGLKSEWKHAKIIVPEVLGWCLALPLFILWESKYARVPIFPGYLFKDRGIFAALAMAVLINFIWYQQGDYMYTVLVVANNESVKSATRIVQLYSFTSVIVGFVVGVLISYVRYLKMFILFGSSMWLLAMGLLIKFRGGDDISHSGIIGSLCLLGFAAGLSTYTVQCSIQTCVNHQHMAGVLATYLASYSIGTSVGSAVSGGLWTNILPNELSKRLDDPELVALAYGSPFTFIATYTWDTVERQAVVLAYRHIQKILCIVGTCFCILLIFFALLLRDHKLTSVVAIEDVELSDKEKSDDESILGWFKRFRK
ncbi:Siderophore iron transporter [Wickerhamomyces ciferrii]|uniref:Siderophore iron transporter n=1 Tax=Wickerhamomyces ciferrii (strain ATCC 14091 / BCRC 22168 / CBS 111 / JCM 3599 / NBRC 0793 / NRRL Y-1031 F-60-10) TaxID=1206466 RepID=K0KND1_WICCF|nr:Siderophore iron transporter [Wickerhamomyces ciferrii]CCH42889.1 Siderophore iron transporter [Wickerhamomyces ciferrii]